MGRVGSRASGILAVLLTALILPGSGAMALAAGASVQTFGGSSPSAAATSSALQASVTWDGANASTARSASAALSANFGGTIALHYVWSSSTPNTISDARLQMFYFGYALSTRDVVDSNPTASDNGTFTMTWQAGALAYLLEGTYRLTASLVNPSGGIVWSQNFYVHDSAPAHLLAAIPIILVLIAIYEVYGLLTAGRPARPPSPPATRPDSAASGAPPASPTPKGGDDP